MPGKKNLHRKLFFQKFQIFACAVITTQFKLGRNLSNTLQKMS